MLLFFIVNMSKSKIVRMLNMFLLKSMELSEGRSYVHLYKNSGSTHDAHYSADSFLILII